MLSPVDVRAIFEGGVMLDFVCCTQEDDVFHCFLSGDRVVALDPIQGWRDVRRQGSVPSVFLGGEKQ